MTIPANRLFSAAPIDSLLFAIEQQIVQAIENMDSSLIINGDLKAMATSLESKYKLNLPSLNHTGRHISGNEDCKVDVRHDHSRNVSDRSKPCLIAGKRITVTVPFVGDAKLLMQNPKAPNAVSTDATVESEEINLVYHRALPLETQLLERDIQNDIDAIEANLTFVSGQIAAFNRNLNTYIYDKLSDRKSAIEAGKNALDGLSLPIRIKEKPVLKAPTSHLVQQPLQLKTTKGKTMDANRNVHEYDVFICHASEDKQSVVDPLTNELIGRGVKVWYDQSILKIGDSLTKKIDEGLAKSKYGIVILSRAFFEKNWPQRELAGLTQKEMLDGTKVILPIWHNVTRDEVAKYSLPLADKMAGNTTDMIVLLNGLLEVLAENTEEPKAKTTGFESIPKKAVAIELKVILDPLKSQPDQPTVAFPG